MATPLVLVSSEVVDVSAPIGASGIVIADINVVSPSVPSPTLAAGRPV